MHITSTNISNPTTIIWNGKEEQTGIYKTPTDTPIFLGKTDVKHDTVIDRKHHGGEFKACYLFSENQYNYWKNLYPNLDWKWGMFGENLTVNGLDESQIYVGDIYNVGDAVVQITQPREPCYKFGVKFGTQKVLKQFIAHGFSGTYVRVLEEGFVKSGDQLERIEHNKNSLTTTQLFQLIFSKEKDQKFLELAVNNDALPEYKRQHFMRFLG
ncbi:MOSC domain-containing protein [Tamlana crocina]|uniref:MOSC domain-containing protein n=1 Tax=Tamlana crocina TaxID=393006 RepID=A0ABX1DC77_9FLAO|nr:MOSC domain-containing protein [Tamlana crocina]NJX14643.1 MOSC domain-containing protein [Tamlana crocina]